MTDEVGVRSRALSRAALIMAALCLLIVACGDDQTSSLPAPASLPSGGTGSGGVAAASDGAAGLGAAGSDRAGASAAGNAATATPSGSAADAGSAAGSGGDPSAPAAGSGGMADAAEAPAPSACEITIPPSMDCGAKLAPGDERTCMLGEREYIVHAGKTMNPCESVGLVIDAHGASETSLQQLGTEEFCTSGDICWHGIGSGWAAESDTPGGGFIAVFPQGIDNVWSASDAEFMLDIVEEMKKLATIDPKKVYMSGISNGGFLTFQTGCAHPDVFKGMAPVAGGTTCSSVSEPIPLISFDAMPDFAYDTHLSANESVVAANNCKGEAKPWLTIDAQYKETVCRSAKQDTMAVLVPCSEVTSTMIQPTVCKIWDDCDGGVKVAWCDVSPNDEHGESNASLDAHILYENNSLLNMPSVAWRFFQLFW